MLLRHPRTLRGAALLRPVLYHEPDQLPDLSNIDVFTSSGALDPYSPPEAIEALRSVLDRSGARATVHVERAAGHGLAPADIDATASWMATMLGAGHRA
jgi:predicted esterase